MQLDIESLRTFVAVVERGGMTKAAESVNLTQSAVSWKIKRLEERVGRPLLIREGRSIRANREGQALLDDARAIIEIHDRAVARLDRAQLSGRVSMGANEDINVERLAAVLGQFSRINPGATVEFVIRSSEEMAALVARGELDLAILQVTRDEMRPDDTLLWSEPLHWTVATSAEFSVDEPLPLVTFGERCVYQRLCRPLLDAAGIEYFTSFSGSSTSAVLAAVEAGLGVGLLAKRYMSGNVIDWPPGDHLVDLPHIHQVLRTDPGEDPAITKALVETITQELG